MEKLWRLFIYPWKFLNGQNFRILIKAIRNEPPDLIIENFRQLLRRGRSQSTYPNKFVDLDDDLKAFWLDCRKEAGILKVVIWVLARKGIDQVTLASEEAILPVKAESFINPEFSALFAKYPDFEQKGFLFQLPYNGPFDQLQVKLTDQEKHQVTLPIATYYLYDDLIPASQLEVRPNDDRKVLVVLHDWEIESSMAPSVQEKQLEWFSKMGWEVIICKEHPDQKAEKLGAKVITYEGLNHSLQGRGQTGSYESKSPPLQFDYLLLLSLDTILPTHFYTSVSNYLQENPSTDILYFDEDLQGPDGENHSPSLKPAFSPEYLAADNYIGSNYCINARLGKEMAWFSPLDFRSGAYGFLLRALEHTSNFARLPKMRIHRLEQNLVYFNRKEVAEIQARTQHFIKQGIKLNPGLVPGSSEVIRPITGEPLVSIIIPFKDQKKLLEQCLSSVFNKTQYPHFEILLISNNSQEDATYEYLEQVSRKYPQIRWFRRDHAFNFSRLNNWGAQQARGAFLLLLNNDVEVITKGWISKMLSYFMQERVGAVGAKLLYPDTTIQHAGIVTGIGGIAGHTHKHFPAHYGGYNGRANKVQNMSACTAACLMIRQSVFDEVDGLNEKDLPVAFNDVDLCLKIHQAGHRIVYSPFVQLFHHESISRGAEDTPAKRKRARKEIRFFRKKWRTFIKAGDPYYHPELSTRMAQFADKRVFGI